MTGACNRVVNESRPIVDARLENGDRLHVVLPPVAVNGPIITIRRFPESPVTMERLLELESLSEEEALFLKRCRPVWVFHSDCGRDRVRENDFPECTLRIYSGR